MKALVTGGTGFVGPSIVHAIRAEGHEVRALVRKPGSKSARRLASWGCGLVEGDMTDAASLERGVEGCDAVVHLVAIIDRSRERTERVMTQATRDLVGAAERAGVGRFILMSAGGTGEASKDLTPYFRAKWDQEQIVRASRLEHVILRPTLVFGREGGPLPLLVRQVRWSPVVAAVGTKQAQPIWIDDVAACFAKALSTPEATNRTFDLAGPDIVTWEELNDRIRRVLGKRRVIFQMPIGIARAGAAVAELLPLSVPISRDALTMLEFADNVGDMGPASETFGVHPIGLTEQIRRAVQS